MDHIISDDIFVLTVVPLHSRFNCSKIPTSNQLSRVALLVRPFFSLNESEECLMLIPLSGESVRIITLYSRFVNYLFQCLKRFCQ